MAQAYLTGMHSRSKILIKARSAYRWQKPFQGRKLTVKDIDRLHRDDSQQLINLQRRASIIGKIDGLLPWNSILELAAKALHGVEIPATNLRRWFNTNTFYHKPIVTGKILLKEQYTKLFEDSLLREGWKAILPGPYTFTMLTENRHYARMEDLMMDYAEALRNLALRLSLRGCRFLQLDEPSLVFRPLKPPLSKDELAHIHEALRISSNGVPLEVSLHTYFESFSPLLPVALDFPVECLGLDFTETPLSELKEYDWTRSIACGVVDARNSLIEHPKHLHAFLEKMIETLNPSSKFSIYLCPNTGLRYLPHILADRKVKALGEAVKMKR